MLDSIEFDPKLNFLALEPLFHRAEMLGVAEVRLRSVKSGAGLRRPPQPDERLESIGPESVGALEELIHGVEVIDNVVILAEREPQKGAIALVGSIQVCAKGVTERANHFIVRGQQGRDLSALISRERSEGVVP